MRFELLELDPGTWEGYMLWRTLHFPADTASRSEVKSKHACRHATCEHGPSTGHRIVNGYCKEHRDA